MFYCGSTSPVDVGDPKGEDYKIEAASEDVASAQNKEAKPQQTPLVDFEAAAAIVQERFGVRVYRSDLQHYIMNDLTLATDEDHTLCKNTAAATVDECGPTISGAEHAAAVQSSLVQSNILARPAAHTTRVVAPAASHLEVPAVWNAPADARATQLYEGLYPLRAKHPRRRVVLDGLLSPAEVRYFAHDALDRFGDPLWDDEGAGEESGSDAETDDGEAATAWPDWAPHPLNERTCRLLCSRVRAYFGEERPLFLAGAMLMRKRPSDVASPAHVDKANKGAYDYSAVLYLSTCGADFDGGEFVFADAQSEEVVEPRAGRAVLFASGTENFHVVRPVARGERIAMGMWFTLTPAEGEVGWDISSPL